MRISKKWAKVKYMLGDTEIPLQRSERPHEMNKLEWNWLFELS